MCTCFLNGPSCPWNTKTLDCVPWPRYVRLNTSSFVSLSASMAFATSMTSTLVWGSPCWHVGQTWVSIVTSCRYLLGARQHAVEEPVIHLGVTLGLPNVVPPDVCAVIGDEDAERSGEPRVCERRGDLLHQFGFTRRVAD